MLLVCGGANGYSCGHTHVPLVEPCGLQQLIVVDTKRCPHTRRSRCESYHERLRERPGLAGKVSCVGSINDDPDQLAAPGPTVNGDPAGSTGNQIRVAGTGPNEARTIAPNPRHKRASGIRQQGCVRRLG